MENQFAPPPSEFNFARYVMELNASRTNKLAYIDDAGEYTYGELFDRSRRFAGLMQSLGLHREERVMVCLTDTIDFPSAFLGCLYAGIVPVLVNTQLTTDDYAYMLANCRAQAVVVSASVLPTMTAALSRCNHEVKQVLVSQPEKALDEGILNLQISLDTSALGIAAITAADEMAFWQYSSGSTGKPKGTVHTHGNLYWSDALYGKNILRLNEDDVVFSAARLFFGYGLGNGIIFPLCAGACAVLMSERPTPQAVFKQLTQRRPTIFYGVPTLYVSMLNSPALPARSEVALRLCTSAGEALPREVGEKLSEHFCCDILDGIGSTEMLHIFLSNRNGDVQYGTTGKPVPGYEVELHDEAGCVCEAGKIGELYVKGPSSALMYWNNREKSQHTFIGEWLKSGDKFWRDDEGYFHYVGRSDDMLKVSGQYVSPFEVETTLMRHPAVLEAAVVGKQDDNGLVKTKAFVVLTDDYTPNEELVSELKNFVKSKLAPHKYPREIQFLPELPKTATGKIQRYKLRD
ncbi:benzoate-CoA ligase family protein [Vogesella sp. DC21W]|uniref:Benzoate-CoA ligase family protein n=1 Tax=Vogesella aquatica TaxID=2984206 RepID=A0ABT5J2J2_9NEIS|nr:benzoate-CoA ligase family protein [Vogesella aquatica]MDC7718686.1 benzoate-CoA ligase family protein [Vogesella aquatica]